MKTFNKTKILCTIGPSCQDKEVLKSMYEAGMDGVRINTAHGDFEQYGHIVDIIREINDSIPILVDIKGPELRAKIVSDMQLSKGRKITVGFDRRSDVYITYDFFNDVKEGDRILFYNGYIESRVVEKDPGTRTLKVEVLTDGRLENNKGVNVPGVHLNIPSLSEKDMKAIEWGKKKDVDVIALSFTRTRDDIDNVRKKLDSDVKLIAKVENNEGVANIDSIIWAADGIMIARGDLGAEMGFENIPMIQKSLIYKAMCAGKLSITATQMLESMITNPVPTRAEVSDVANAVLDGTDCVMLSGETAIGRYPVEAVATMARITQRIESDIISKPLSSSTKERTISEAVTMAIPVLAKEVKASKIVAMTRSGFTARMISRFRMPVDVFAITSNKKVFRKLNMFFGIIPILMSDAEQTIPRVSRYMLEKHLATEDEIVIFSSGTYKKRSHHSNMIEVHWMSEHVGSKD